MYICIYIYVCKSFAIDSYISFALNLYIYIYIRMYIIFLHFSQVKTERKTGK